MEIRLNIDDDFAKELMTILGEKKAATFTRDALTLLKWAAQEKKLGRVILSTNKDGADIKQLAMPTLDNIKNNI